MLDFIIEVILEIIVNGTIEAAGNKKISKPVRVLLVAILVMFFGGITGLLFWIWVTRNSWLLMLIAAIFLVLIILVAINKTTRFQKRKTSRKH